MIVYAVKQTFTNTSTNYEEAGNEFGIKYITH